METSLSTCVRCGLPQQPGAKFCGGCGQPMSGPPAGTLPPRSAAQAASGQAYAASVSSAEGENPFNGQVMLAFGLAAAGLLFCGPLTCLPGAFLAWNEQQRQKSVGANASGAFMALLANVAVGVISLFGCMLLGLFGMLAA